MLSIDLETVRIAMFAHPGVKAVGSDLRLYRTGEGLLAVTAKVKLAAADVDQATVRRVVEAVLLEQFGICEVDLWFEDPGTVPSHSLESRGPLEKK